MIKFFRKIRQKMIKENKASKYLLYAIGEIILVVIGILIALAINNNNEDSKFRKQEIKYLKNLKSDISLELKNNDSLIKYRVYVAKASARLLNLKTLETVEDFINAEFTMNQVFTRKIFIPTNNTYKELLSSGNLNFITNDALKNQLLELDKLYVSISNSEHHMYREYEEYLYNVAIKNGEALNALDIQKIAATGNISFVNPSEIPVNILIPQYNRLLMNIIFRNGLKLSVANNVGISMQHKDMTNFLLQLNQLIEDDLNKD